MRVLITGIAGFVGSHLADYLIKKGHSVIGIDNFLTGDIKNVNPKVKFYQKDITQASIREYFEEVDWVFHEAANARTQVSVDNPMLNNEVNIKGTLNVLLAARDAGVKKVMFASSCILYSPNTPYYVSKLAGEEYMNVFRKIYNLPTINLRYSNVYGSLRQSEKGSDINALASLHKSKRDNGRIWITGDGTQVRDWSHVLDVCRANLMAAESNVVGTYDICTGVHTSMNEIAKYFNCPIDYVEGRKGDQHDLGYQDSRTTEEAFGYKYEISLNEESLKPYL